MSPSFLLSHLIPFSPFTPKISTLKLNFFSYFLLHCSHVVSSALMSFPIPFSLYPWRPQTRVLFFLSISDFFVFHKFDLQGRPCCLLMGVLSWVYSNLSQSHCRYAVLIDNVTGSTYLFYLNSYRKWYGDLVRMSHPSSFYYLWKVKEEGKKGNILSDVVPLSVEWRRMDSVPIRDLWGLCGKSDSLSLVS